MSRSPSGTSASSSSSNSSFSRRARKAPRRCTPTRATGRSPGFRSAISWARRVSARCTSRSRKTTFWVGPSIVSFLASPDRIKGAAAMYQGEGTVSGRGDRLGVAGKRRRGSLGALRSGPAPRPLHEPGGPPLWERYLDRVEVPRGLGVGEHRAGLIAQLPAGVAAGDMGDRQQPRRCIAGELGGLGGGGVRGLPRTLRLLGGERG